MGHGAKLSDHREKHKSRSDKVLPLVVHLAGASQNIQERRSYFQEKSEGPIEPRGNSSNMHHDNFFKNSDVAPVFATFLHRGASAAQRRFFLPDRRTAS
ncbi:hypothetical protein [Pseudophaeobacter sp.]|uniref:hypothetical protein n=1 Tax=Pseudophaeobacter sp. TaxID=1971739 RepID=UPI00405A1638